MDLSEHETSGKLKVMAVTWTDQASMQDKFEKIDRIIARDQATYCNTIFISTRFFWF